MTDPGQDQLNQLFPALAMQPPQPQPAVLQPAPAVAAPPPQTPQVSMASPGQPRSTLGAIQPQTQTDQQRLDDLKNSKSAVENLQTKHPVWGGILRGLDVAGSILAPKDMSMVPGTTLNHQQKIGQAQGALNNDLGREKEQAQTTGTEAETQKTEAETNNLENPAAAKEQDPEKDAYAYYTKQGLNPADAYKKVLSLKMGDKQPNEKSPEMQAFNSLLAGGAKPEEAYQQLSKLKQTEKADTGAQDDQRYEQTLAKQLKGETLNTDEAAFLKAYKARKTLGAVTTNNFAIERATTAEERKREDEATREAAGGEKASAKLKADTVKTYQPALDSGERLNVMAKNYEDGVKDHNQQAMLSLLANHLGMTMGLQKGARMSKDIIQEAQHSMPWLQGMQAKFGPDGYMTGVTLSPAQMKQMVDLGHERFSQDIGKARSTAKYMGATDDGPERTPSKSVINYYKAQAGGNGAKAKQLATEAGWTVK